MRTLEQYVAWMRRMQFESDSERVQIMVCNANQKTKLHHYSFDSGIPLYVGSDNQIIGLNLNLEQTLNIFNGLDFQVYDMKDDVSGLIYANNTQQHTWTDKNNTLTGYTLLEPADIHFKYVRPNLVITPIGLEVENCEGLWEAYGDDEDDSVHIQTTTGIFPNGRINRRIAEDSVLNILEYIVKNKISGFYGMFKSHIGVINKP